MARPTTSLGTRVGARVRYERARQSLTRLGLSRQAGLSLAYLQQLEGNNVKNPTEDTLHKLAAALGVGVADLAAGAPDGLPGEVAEAKARVAEAIRKARASLPPDEADAVLRSFVDLLEGLARAQATPAP